MESFLFFNTAAARFSDVAGLTEAKAEIIEFVQLLKDPSAIAKLGGRMPKVIHRCNIESCSDSHFSKHTVNDPQTHRSKHTHHQ